MNKYYETICMIVALILFISSLLLMNGLQDAKIANQATLIEQLQGDVKAMTSAFEEISLELLKSQYAIASWSNEIDKLRDARDGVSETPEIRQWKNKKEATRGLP